MIYVTDEVVAKWFGLQDLYCLKHPGGNALGWYLIGRPQPDFHIQDPRTGHAWTDPLAAKRHAYLLVHPEHRTLTESTPITRNPAYRVALAVAGIAAAFGLSVALCIWWRVAWVVAGWVTPV